VSYAFSQIFDQLQDQQQKANVFGQQGEGSQQQQGQQAPEAKTSTEGSVTDGGGGASEVSAPKESLDVSGTEASQAASKAARGKTQSPVSFEKIGQSIAGNTQALQNEANAYVETGKAEQQYNLENPDLEKAIGGDQEAASKTSSLLNRASINPVAQFKAKTDIGNKDLADLGSDTGLRGLLARGQGPSYTSGMAAFDAAALGRDAQFQQTLRALQGQQQDLEKMRSALEGSESDPRKQVETYGTAQLKAAQDAARGYLGSQATTLQDAQAKEAADINAQLADLRKYGGSAFQASGADLGATQKQMMSDLQSTNPALYQMLMASQGDTSGAASPWRGVKASDFVNVRGDVGAGDVWDDKEAQRFNAIQGLLGGTDVMSAGAGAGPLATFNTEGYRNAFTGAAQNEYDALTSQLSGITSANKKAVESMNKQTAAGRAERDPEIKSAQKVLDIISSGTIDPALKAAILKEVNPDDFYSKGSDASDKQIYDEKAYKQLRALEKKLGVTQSTYTLGKKGKKAGFDEDAYGRALAEAYARKVGGVAAEASPDGGASRGPTAPIPGTGAAGGEDRPFVPTPDEARALAEKNAKTINEARKKYTPDPTRYY